VDCSPVGRVASTRAHGMEENTAYLEDWDLVLCVLNVNIIARSDCWKVALESLH
jgi:hypothetical protein